MKVQIIELANQLWVETLKDLRHDIYHLPNYIYLEAERTNTTPEAILISEGDKQFFVPYLLRRCDDLFNGEFATPDVFDVISPYGYPGILLNQEAIAAPDFLQAAIKELITALSEKQVCSAFFRLHPILNEGLEKIYMSDICQITGETVSVNLTLPDTEIWSQTRSDHRKDINRHKRSGLVARMVSAEDYLDEFVAIYHETMNRVVASDVYYFPNNFFADLCHKLGENLHLGIVEYEQEIMCACLFTECCGIVQSYLSGTKNKFLKLSPDKLLFDYVRFWAKERGNKVLHLGGGYGGAKDGVYNFKAGFSKLHHNFLTMRLIIDEKKYNYMVNQRAKALNIHSEQLFNSHFFPAYRSQ
jgi:Acetyltransferase (GNAT) domain